jgi:chromosome segregation ATPase
MDHNEAFITGIDAGGLDKYGKGSKTLLDPVRKEHKKMKEVVHYFSTKVESLVDKQRNEYIQAYESHMQEVQKELHSLREKVADIANDETKNEKTESLKANQKKYKEEALKLETDSDEILKKIKKLIRKIYTVGELVSLSLLIFPCLLLNFFSCCPNV